MKIVPTEIVATNPFAPEAYERLFENYLNICSQALEKNKDKFPYTEIWNARWKALGPNNIMHCAVYDDRPKMLYTLQLTENMQIKVIKKTHADPDRVPSGEVWPFKYSYLKHVVDNPVAYIDHPANLDWGWLTDVLADVRAPSGR